MIKQAFFIRKMKTKNIRLNNKISEFFIKIGQLIYLSTEGFYENNMFESINSCAFGFIFSFIPLILIILVILSGILHAYPSLYAYVMNFVTNIESVIDIKPLINQIMTMKSISWVEIVLGFWIIWMARKLFASVLQAINKIFRSYTLRTTWFNQIFVFILEFVLVIAVILIVLVIFVLNKILSIPFFQKLDQFLPLATLSKISSNVSLITYVILFVFTTIIFRMASGVKPRIYICAIYAALATLSFFVVSWFLHTFVNTTNYNIVYGTISSIIVLMMQVWFFFLIFLFFAQMVFSTEYREVLSLGVLYMMPEKESENEDFLTRFKRNLFRSNPSKYTKYETVQYNPGEVIFREGDVPNGVYYIRSGSVYRKSQNSESTLSQGAFFGEMHCILNQDRNSTVTAITPCVITKINTDEFLQMLHNNPKAGAKAIAKVSSYTAELYKMFPE